MKLYNVTTAAKLTDVHPQTLRTWERVGLIVPKRTLGGVRRYTDFNIEQIQAVKRLSGSGINLEGVRIIMSQQEEINILRRQVIANSKGSVFTGDTSGISVQNSSNLTLRERLRIMREMRRRKKFETRILESRAILQIDAPS